MQFWELIMFSMQFSLSSKICWWIFQKMKALRHYSTDKLERAMFFFVNHRIPSNKKVGFMVLKTMIHCALVSLRFAVSWDLNSIPLNQGSNDGLRKPDIFSLRILRNRIFCNMFWNLSSSPTWPAMLYFSSINQIR